MVVFIHLTFVKCKAQGLEEKTACEMHGNSWNRLQPPQVKKNGPGLPK